MQFTTREPVYRFSDIADMMREVGITDDWDRENQRPSDPFLHNFGVAIGTDFLQLEGRVLPAPRCNFTVGAYKEA